MAPWEECRYRVGREALGRCAGHKNNYLSHGAIVWGEKPPFLHHEIKQSWRLSPNIPPPPIYCTLICLFIITTLPLAASVSHISSQFITICQSSARIGRPTHEALKLLKARSLMKERQNRNRMQNGQINVSTIVCNMKHAWRPPQKWCCLIH